MKKLSLLFLAFCGISCVGYATDYLIVDSIEACDCPKKYKIGIKTNEKNFNLYTDSYYKVGDTLK